MGSAVQIKDEQMIELHRPKTKSKPKTPDTTNLFGLGAEEYDILKEKSLETRMDFHIRKHVPILGERVLTVLENLLLKIDFLAALPRLSLHILNDIETDSESDSKPKGFQFPVQVENILGPTCTQAILRLIATQMAWKESKSGRIPWNSYPRSSPRVLQPQLEKIVSDKLHFDHNLDYPCHVDLPAETKSKSKLVVDHESPHGKPNSHPYGVASVPLIASGAGTRETRQDALEDDLMNKNKRQAKGQEHGHEMIFIQEEQDKANSLATYGLKSKSTSKSSIQTRRRSVRPTHSIHTQSQIPIQTQTQIRTQAQNHKQSPQKQEHKPKLEQDQDQEQGRDEDNEKERKKQRLISFLEKDAATFTFLSDILNMAIEIDKNINTSTKNTKDDAAEQKPESPSSSLSSSSASRAFEADAIIAHHDMIVNTEKEEDGNGSERKTKTRDDEIEGKEEQVDALPRKEKLKESERPRRKMKQEGKNRKKNTSDSDRANAPHVDNANGRERKGKVEILGLIRTALKSKYEDHVRKALRDKDAKALMCMLSLVAHANEEERREEERQERQTGDERHTNHSHSNPITVICASRQRQSSASFSSSSSHQNDISTDTNSHHSPIYTDMDQPMAPHPHHSTQAHGFANLPLSTTTHKTNADANDPQLPASHSPSESSTDSDSTGKETQMERRQVRRHKVTGNRFVYGKHQHTHSAGHEHQHHSTSPVREDSSSTTNGRDNSRGREVKETSRLSSREKDEEDVSGATVAPPSTSTASSSSSSSSSLNSYNLEFLFKGIGGGDVHAEMDDSVSGGSDQSLHSDIWGTFQTDDVKTQIKSGADGPHLPDQLPQTHLHFQPQPQHVIKENDDDLHSQFKPALPSDQEGNDKDDKDWLINPSDNVPLDAELKGSGFDSDLGPGPSIKSDTSSQIQLQSETAESVQPYEYISHFGVRRSASKVVYTSRESETSTSTTTNRFSWTSQNTNANSNQGTDTDGAISENSIWEMPNVEYLEIKPPSTELLAITEEEVSIEDHSTSPSSNNSSEVKASPHGLGIRFGTESSRSRSARKHNFLVSGSPMPHEARITSISTATKTKEEHSGHKMDGRNEGVTDLQSPHSQEHLGKLQLYLEEELRKRYKEVINSLLQNPIAIEWIREEQALHKKSPSYSFLPLVEESGSEEEFAPSVGFTTFQSLLRRLKESMRDRLATDLIQDLHLQQTMKERWKNEQRHLRQLSVLKKEFRDLKRKHVPQMLTLDFQIRILNSRLREVFKESFQDIREVIRESELNAEVKMKSEVVALDQSNVNLCLKEYDSEMLKKQHLMENSKFKQTREALNGRLMTEIKRYDDKFFELQDDLDDITEETVVYEEKVKQIQKKYEDIQSRFTDMKAEQKLKSILRRAKQADEMKRHKAAKLIQETWRKYKIRKKKREKRLAKKKGKKKGGGVAVGKKREGTLRDSESPASRSQSTSEVKSTPARSRQVSVVKSKVSSSMGSVGSDTTQQNTKANNGSPQ